MTDIEIAAEKIKALTEELKLMGLEVALYAVDTAEHKTYFEYFAARDAKHLFMSLAMEIAITGMPVPLLMTAIAHGAQAHFQNQAAPKTETDDYESFFDENTEVH